MDHRPIGIFDSGLGGLNGLRALRSFLPDENVVYFADSGRLPYGAKSRAQLRVMAQQDLDFLRRLDAPRGGTGCHRSHRHGSQYPQRQLSAGTPGGLSEA